MYIEEKKNHLLEEPSEVISIVPIFRVNNYTEERKLIGFTVGMEEANEVVKALCWRDIEDYTFRYVAGYNFIDRIRVEYLESMEFI